MIEHTPVLEIVMGLPGAGKSTYLRQQLAAGYIDGFYDDYQKGAPEDDSSNPSKSPNFIALVRDIDQGKRVAIADIRYCISEELQLVQQTIHNRWPMLRIMTVAFENNVEACRRNVQKRARPERVEIELQYIEDHSAAYQPSGDKIVPVIIG